MKKLEIAFAKTAAEAEKFMCQGYCRWSVLTGACLL